MKLDRKKVRVAMAERGINQKQLAGLAEIESATLSCIMTGKSGGRPETWDKISKALGIPTLDILETN